MSLASGLASCGEPCRPGRTGEDFHGLSHASGRQRLGESIEAHEMLTSGHRREAQTRVHPADDPLYGDRRHTTKMSFVYCTVVAVDWQWGHFILIPSFRRSESIPRAGENQGGAKADRTLGWTPPSRPLRSSSRIGATEAVVVYFMLL
jgi:hypothetical protein